jgi:ABC-type lipoprotein export system ATPase subunit
MSTHAVRAHDVFCLYPTPTGHVAALRGLSLDVAAGERVVVHGPNGSGKTTLLRVLAGDRAASAGAATVCGTELLGASARDLVRLRARSLGLIDQRHAQTLRPELSIVDNVALQLRVAGLGRREARTRASGVLAELELAHLAPRRPASLSGGEAQRVAVCAAVAHRPALVLADEPTGELDRDGAEAVYDLLARAVAAVGAAMVLVTHDAAAARVADRIVRIRDGRLSEQWEPGEAGRETLVVDDRGWVRLPEPLRRLTGVTTGVRASSRDHAIVLSATSASTVDTVVEVPAREAEPAAAEPVATVTEVSVAADDRQILTAQDLVLRPGELTVVTGRSGSGKTTLLRVLSGLLPPDAGEVTIGGTKLSTLDRERRAALRRDTLMVAGQGAALAETLDVAGNIELVRQARRLRPDPAVVAHWLAELGLAALRHRPVEVLSGGERQRVAVARVLAAEPMIAVLDEPTSQQDEANAERVVAALAAAARAGTAVVAASHDPVLVGAADQVVTLAG